MDTQRTHEPPDKPIVAVPYPYGMKVRITYTDHMDAQQIAAWRRIWAWVMAPIPVTAGATAGKAP